MIFIKSMLGCLGNTKQNRYNVSRAIGDRIRGIITTVSANMVGMLAGSSVRTR